jgi:hypothetical protein
MKEGTIVARELVERLWADPPAGPPPPAAQAAALGPNDHIVHRPDLAFLNRSWVWSNASEGPDRGGFAARVRRWLRTRIARLILTSIDRYLLEERAFIEHLVRFQNQVAETSDRLSDEIRQVAAAESSLAVWTQDRIDELWRRTDLLHGLLESRVLRLEASTSRERETSR